MQDQKEKNHGWTVQKTMILCTAAIILAIYAISDEAFWKPQTPWEVWCSENDKPWMFNDPICKGAWILHRYRQSR